MKAPNIRADEISIGKRVTFGNDVVLRGRSIRIGDDTSIGDDVDVTCPDGFSVGSCSYIGAGTLIRCWRFEAGSYQFYERDMEVGRGGCLGSPEATVTFGDDVMIAPEAVINPARRVVVGSRVGIGDHVRVWTHGAWTSEFGVRFAPVTIGSDVWIPGGCIVLPGVTIGSHVVVGMKSLVNRDLPDGCLAGGVPARVVRAGQYPLPMEKRLARIGDLVEAYRASAAWRGVAITVELHVGHGTAVVSASGGGGSAAFDLAALRMIGTTSAEVEDCRDFLRRHGWRILTGRPFVSISHPEVDKWSRAT